MYRATRFSDNPIIHEEQSPTLGGNINGPSLIKAPDWVPEPLGRYYLYFAHHQGAYIRLAYADQVKGPWRIHEPGTLRLEQTACRHHVASPDVHVDAANQQVVMYFHGCTEAGQRSFRAVSDDGIHFRADDMVLGPFYFRVFRHQDAWYAIATVVDAPGGGRLLRSPDGRQPFEPGPSLIPQQRHVAVLKRDGFVDVFFSRGEDCPERILVARMPLTGDWRTWQPGAPHELLAPETAYEGGHLPLVPSHFGAIHEPARQLRDPAVFDEDGRLYLLYSGAGEQSICLAELAVQ
jgi:hypothetical protein